MDNNFQTILNGIFNRTENFKYNYFLDESIISSFNFAYFIKFGLSYFKDYKVKFFTTNENLSSAINTVENNIDKTGYSIAYDLKHIDSLITADLLEFIKVPSFKSSLNLQVSSDVEESSSAKETSNLKSSDDFQEILNIIISEIRKREKFFKNSDNIDIVLNNNFELSVVNEKEDSKITEDESQKYATEKTYPEKTLIYLTNNYDVLKEYYKLIQNRSIDSAYTSIDKKNKDQKDDPDIQCKIITRINMPADISKITNIIKNLNIYDSFDIYQNHAMHFRLLNYFTTQKFDKFEIILHSSFVNHPAFPFFIYNIYGFLKYYNLKLFMLDETYEILDINNEEVEGQASTFLFNFIKFLIEDKIIVRYSFDLIRESRHYANKDQYETYFNLSLGFNYQKEFMRKIESLRHEKRIMLLCHDETVYKEIMAFNEEFNYNKNDYRFINQFSIDSNGYPIIFNALLDTQRFQKEDILDMNNFKNDAEFTKEMAEREEETLGITIDYLTENNRDTFNYNLEKNDINKIITLFNIENLRFKQIIIDETVLLSRNLSLFFEIVKVYLKTYNIKVYVTNQAIMALYNAEKDDTSPHYLQASKNMKYITDMLVEGYMAYISDYNYTGNTEIILNHINVNHKNFEILVLTENKRIIDEITTINNSSIEYFNNNENNSFAIQNTMEKGSTIVNIYNNISPEQAFIYKETVNKIEGFISNYSHHVEVDKNIDKDILLSKSPKYKILYGNIFMNGMIYIYN